MKNFIGSIILLHTLLLFIGVQSSQQNSVAENRKKISATHNNSVIQAIPYMTDFELKDLAENYVFSSALVAQWTGNAQESIKALRASDNKKYNDLVQETIQKIYQQEPSSLAHVISRLRNKAQEDHDFFYTQKIAQEKGYRQVRNDCLCYGLRNTVFAITAGACVGAIGFFSWMINNCNS